MRPFALIFLVANQILPSAAGQSNLTFEWVPVATDLYHPTSVTHANDGSGRVFVTDQGGRVILIRNGQAAPQAFLDVSDRVSGLPPGCCEEWGLLGIAFPPHFAAARHFYLFYTDANLDVTISRFSVSDDPDIADPASEDVILKIPHNGEVTHFGGQLAFSPLDGQLYASLGDGGGGGDSQHSGQDPERLLAKIVRIDVENGGTIPETVAMGLRNPWRFSFDRITGDLYIGDVGEGSWEEIDFRSAFAEDVYNYAWSVYEGDHCLWDANCESDPAFIGPIYEYSHEEGCSVTGGYVYRGNALPDLQGIYLFADFCKGFVRGISWAADRWNLRLSTETPFNISTFGEDESGELYVADFVKGSVYKLVAGGSALPQP